jgi:15-cis-phytoene desaturase
MPYTVAVFGGGVAGLSAAHELAERGFEVHVYERRPGWGGKARSIPVPSSSADSRPPLPGEHGFRFFPGFYKHVTDTMRRIPFGATGNVYENLRIATRVLLARSGQTELTWLARRPETLEDLHAFLMSLFTPLDVPLDETAFFVNKLLMVATSCAERRLAEYENIAWWDFIQAPRMSKQYQAYLGQGLTRSLVAMRAEESSTRTVGVTQLQLLYAFISPEGVFDRLLGGPTNDLWITPWTQYLEKRGVHFHAGQTLTQIGVSGRRVTSAALNGDAGPTNITADYYISALPVEVMTTLVTDELKRAAPSIANLNRLSTRWMNGIQFYVAQDVPIVNGHAIYLNSPWALTSISQHQFWTGVDLSKFGNGKVRGIISVDISDWDAPGVVFNKPARECTAEEIKTETWMQLKQHLNVDGAKQIDDANLLTWFLDPDIQFPNPGSAANAEPLMINTAGSLKYRPEAQIELENLFLASDYVRTYTDIACMEAANEAARRAVNCLLLASGSNAEPARLWPLEDPDFLKPFQEIDRIRFSLSLPQQLSAAAAA